VVATIFYCYKYSRWNGIHAYDSKGQIFYVGKDMAKTNIFIRKLFRLATYAKPFENYLRKIYYFYNGTVKYPIFFAKAPLPLPMPRE